MTIRVLSEHRCKGRHPSAAAFARCAFPAALSVHGVGSFAVLTCAPLGVSLWPTVDRAREAKAVVDDSGCGRACTHEHELVALDYDEALAG